ncbi:MAG: ABC transporter permease [Trueperaceae bacterium]|nr:MAG: ABC transporter permease [Trueperaceae bacterium]
MFSLAWRNIWRNRRRCLLTASSVVMVASLTLVLFGCSAALKNGMFQNLTEDTGHLVVQVESWRDVRAFDQLLIDEATQLQDLIEEISPAAELAALLEVPTLLSGKMRSRGIRLIGIAQPAALEGVFKAKYLAAGQLIQPHSLDEVILGTGLARALRVGLGDTVYAYAPGTEGYGAVALTVVGLLDLPATAFAARTAYVSLSAAQELAAPDAVTRFELHLPELKRLADENEITGLQKKLSSQLPEELVVESWRQVNPDLATILDLLEPMLLFYAFIFFGMAGLLVVNTVYLSLVERIREFGVIISLGAGRWKVMRLVLLETGLLVLGGSLVGGGLGVLGVLRMSQGFTMPLGLAEIYAEFGLPTMLYASLSTGQVLSTLLFAITTAMLAALWPAWVAGRLEPVEAMKFVT